MPRRQTRLIAGHTYHVFNRGNDRREIFDRPYGYADFVRLLRTYLVDAGDLIVCYCLMPNHFHLMLRPFNDHASRRLGRLQMAYSKAHQRRTGRIGSLY